MKKTIILIFLSLVALIIVIGSAGAWDNGTIGFGQFAIQSLIGVALAYFSLKNIDM